VLDLIFTAATLAFFAACALYTRALEKL